MKILTSLPSDEGVTLEIERLNKGKGELDKEDGIECNTCLNRGYIAIEQDRRVVTRTCQCMKKRNSFTRFKKTDLSEKYKKYTFSRYKPEEEYQKVMLESAKKYTECKNNWFYIGGQVGCGKTHICTAILNQLTIKNNYSFEYLPWQSGVNTLKILKTGSIEQKEKYENDIERLRKVDILFIDDLFKTEPSKPDIDILHDIINTRYLKELRTIISSEKSIKQALEIDEAIGSRIKEMTKDKENGLNFCLDIGYTKDRNYRL